MGFEAPIMSALFWFLGAMSARSLRWLWHALLEASMAYGTSYYPVPLMLDPQQYDDPDRENYHDDISYIAPTAAELCLGSAAGKPRARQWRYRPADTATTPTSRLHAP